MSTHADPLTGLIASFAAVGPCTSLILSPMASVGSQFDDVSLLDLYVNMIALKRMLGIQEDWPISDTTSAEKFAEAFASQKSNAFLQLALFLPTESSLQQTCSMETSSTTFNSDILRAIFSGFALSTAATAVINGILSKSFDTLHQGLAVDILLTIYYLDDVAGLAGVKVVKMRNLHLHMVPTAGPHAEGHTKKDKTKKKETLAFQMSYFDSTFGFNEDLFASNRQMILEALNAAVPDKEEQSRMSSMHVLDESHK